MKNIIKTFVSLAFIFALFLFVLPRNSYASGHNCLWTGLGSDNKWSTASNWACTAGGIVPTNGDDILITSGSPRETMNNDISSLTVHQLFFSGTSGTAIILNGNAITNGAIISSDATVPVTINTNLTLSASIPIAVNSGAGTLTLSNTINLGGHDLTFMVPSSTTMVSNADIEGTGNVNFAVAGHLNIGQNSAYTGSVSITGGGIVEQRGNYVTFGNPSNTITVSENSTIMLSSLITGTYTFVNPITLSNGTILSFMTSNLLINSVNLAAGTNNSFNAFTSMNHDHFISNLSGSGNLSLVGDAETFYLANSVGTYSATGNITLQSPTRILRPIPAHLIINDTDGLLGGNGSAASLEPQCGTMEPTYFNSSERIFTVTGNLIANGSCGDNIYNFHGFANNNTSQIAVGGDVNLGSASFLTFTPEYSPVIGDTFRVIDNQGTNPVTGRFGSLAEGRQYIDSTHHVYTISYHGGDGNDVVLTYIGLDTHNSFSILNQGTPYTWNGSALNLITNITDSTSAPITFGTVTFRSGPIVIGTSTLNSAGAAQYIVTALPSYGVNNITATFNGDGTHAVSTSSANVTIIPNLFLNTTTPHIGQDVILMAEIYPRSGTGVGSGFVNQISFYDGSTLLGSVPISDYSANFVVHNLSNAVHSFSAKFVFDPNTNTISTSNIIGTNIDEAPSLANTGSPVWVGMVLGAAMIGGMGVMKRCLKI